MIRLSKGAVIESFEQLEQGLKDWRSFADPGLYDVGGMMALLCACLENLRKNVPASELRDLGATLNEDELAILEVLCGA